jgi:hypothetical protein
MSYIRYQMYSWKLSWRAFGTADWSVTRRTRPVPSLQVHLTWKGRAKMSAVKLQKWLREKLARHDEKGIPISEIPFLWEHDTSSPFSLQQFGFSKRQGLCAALKTFSDIVTVTENDLKILTAYPAKKAGDEMSLKVTVANTLQPNVLISSKPSSETQPRHSYNHLKRSGDCSNDVRRWLHEKISSSSNKGLLASTIPDLWKTDRSAIRTIVSLHFI